MSKAPELTDEFLPPDEIVQAGLNGDLVLFVGAGASMLLGLPSCPDGHFKIPHPCGGGHWSIPTEGRGDCQRQNENKGVTSAVDCCSLKCCLKLMITPVRILPQRIV